MTDPAIEQAVRQSFLLQAHHGQALGSPFLHQLCRVTAERLNMDTAVGKAVLQWQFESVADAVALRFCGALHALKRQMPDDALTAVFPPYQVDDAQLWTAIASALEQHSAFILRWLKSAPQTNEVRRSSALLGGFLTLARLHGKPLILSEIGASAGLNLLWDHYHYRLGALEWAGPHNHPETRPIHLQPEWEGRDPESAPILVQNRAGCDLNPLDPARAEDRERLMAYIWADQSDRLERTGLALQLAAELGKSQPEFRVEKADAIEFLKKRLATRHDGASHVIYHSIAWQYLPRQAQEEGAKLIADAGASADINAPLAHLAMEADGQRDSAALTLQIWPTGEKQQLARVDFHGRFIRWTGWQ